MDEIDRLIQAIVESGVKRSWLAAEVGIGKSTLSRIERGEKETVDVRLYTAWFAPSASSPRHFTASPSRRS